MRFSDSYSWIAADIMIYVCALAITATKLLLKSTLTIRAIVTRLLEWLRTFEAGHGVTLLQINSLHFPQFILEEFSFELYAFIVAHLVIAFSLDEA